MKMLHNIRLCVLCRHSCGRALPCPPAPMHLCLSVNRSSVIGADNKIMCGCICVFLSWILLDVTICVSLCILCNERKQEYVRKGCLGNYGCHLCMLYDGLVACMHKMMKVRMILMLQLPLCCTIKSVVSRKTVRLLGYNSFPGRA